MTRLGLVLAALAGHWRRHPIELATLVVGLMAATALWSGVQALNAEARASYDRAAALLGADRLARVVAAGGGRLAVADFVALRRAGWPASPVLEGEITAGEVRLRVIGVEPLSLPAEAETFAIGPGAERLNDFLAPPNLGLVAPETAARLAGAPGLPPLAEAPDLPPDTMMVDIAAAERLLAAPGAVSHLILAGPAADQPLPDALVGRAEVRPPDPEGELARLTRSFHLNLAAFGMLAFVVGLLIVYAAIGLAFEQRKPTFRSLRACGVSARLLAAAMLVELGAVALAAGLLGVAAGYAMAASLLPDVAASLRGLYGARVAGSLALDPAWWAAGLGMCVAGALAAGAASLVRAARLPVLATAQPEAWRAAERRRLRSQTVLAALLALAGLAAFRIAGGLGGGLALMGALLLAAALALPAVLAAALAVGARTARGPIAEWLWADARQQLSGLSLALMALLVALAVNIGVGTMVGSFRLTFTGWLDQRLASEVYVTGRDAAEAEALAAWIDARPEVTARLPIWNAETRVDGLPVEVYGVADHATYRDNWPMLALAPGGWDRLAAGEAAFVSEQLARRAGLGLGDSLALPTSVGRWETAVAGIYSDYGNPQGQAIVALPVLEAQWPGIERRRFALRLDPGDAPALVAALRAEFGLPEGQVIDQAALKAFSLRVFERTFAVTVALNALTLAVAGIALFTCLLTLAGLRLGQLAPVWALGVTRRRLALLDAGKTLGLAALTALVAAPVGLAVAWVLTAVVNVEAFGWRLPIHLFPGRWLALVGLALLTALAAAAWPALRLARAEPVDLLRRFSNER
jgi:putative ABC transport system permease protein